MPDIPNIFVFSVMHQPSRIRGTLPEALITGAAILGFVYLTANNAINTWNDVWLYIGTLGLLVLFYFFLLLAHAIFLFMAGSDNFWWEKNQERYWKAWEEESKAKQKKVK
jgi:hypothetical protein